MFIISIKRKVKKMSKKFEFVRKFNYRDETIKKAKDAVKGGKLLAVPQSNFIRVYCYGINMIDKITDKSFKLSDNVANGFTIKDKNDIISSFNNKMPKDKERKSSQIIALNNMSFDDDKYSVCGWECTIPSGDVKIKNSKGNNKKPEIDLVAVCPDKKEILLIEYKCNGKSMLKGNQNIKQHYNDYTKIIKKPEFAEHLKVELLKAYNVAKLIYTDKPSAEYDPSDFVIKIGFLFADSVTVNNENSSISDDDYAKAYDILKKAGLDKETVYIRATNDHSVRLDNWKTVDGSGLAVTQK